MATVRKRAWKTKGEITKTAWVVRYTDQAGQRHIKTFERKKDADAYLHEVAREVVRGTHVAERQSPTVTDAAAEWLRQCEDGDGDREPLERCTVREYRRYVDRYLCHPVKGIGGYRLSQLTMGVVKSFESRWLDEADPVHLSRSTIRRVRMALSSVLSYARERQLVGHHVLREAKRRRGARKGRDGRQIKIPDKNELRALIDGACATFRPFLITAIFSGMRAGELRGLTWDHRRQCHPHSPARRSLEPDWGAEVPSWKP